MDIITKKNILDLITEGEGPALSIYMPTFKAGRRKEQGPILLKNLLQKAVNQFVASGMGQGKIKAYLQPIKDLIEDEVFWQKQTEGLVLFLDNLQLHLFQLPDPVEEHLFIGNHFQITPLIPVYQGNGQYILLQIDQDRPILFQGTKFNLHQIDHLDLPQSLQEMFDDFYEFHSHLSFHTSTSTPNPDLASARDGVFFDQSGGDDINVKAEILNFFHRFDDALMDYLAGQETALVLAGAGFLHNIYRQANRYPNLLDEGITKKIDQMPKEELHKMSWQIVQKKYEKDVEQARSVFRQLDAENGESTVDTKEIVEAAYYQRVDTLFAAENVHAWGTYYPDVNKVTFDEKQSITNDDLINFAASHTLLNGGQVLVLPQIEMPDQTKAAAILRF